LRACPKPVAHRTLVRKADVCDHVPEPNKCSQQLASTFRPCNDGSNGFCELGSEGGICYRAPPMTPSWSCGCSSGYWCSSKCNTRFSAHQRRAVTAMPTKVPTTRSIPRSPPRSPPRYDTHSLHHFPPL
jgi:hypothetical protein